MIEDELAVRASEFESFLGYQFRDRKLLHDALVSRGLPNERGDLKVRHRQALLSNIGDTVIDVLVTEHLILDEGINDEGTVTLMRNHLVKRDTLNLAAQPIMPFVLMTSGERNVDVASHIPAECLEAVVGALYLDGEMGPARMLLEKLRLFDGD
jgi:ribonuclease III